MTKSTEPVLAAHNVNFDARMLISSCDRYNIDAPRTLQFADTLPLFKKRFVNVANYKQETIVKEILGKSYNAHNALKDCRTLCELLEKMFEGQFPSNISFSSKIQTCLFTK